MFNINSLFEKEKKSDEPSLTVKGTVANFEKEVIKDSGIVLIDFWATWCPPCKMIAPILETVAKEKNGEIKVVKVDVDKEPALAQMFQISSIPTLVLFNKGKMVNSISGAMPKAQLLKWVYASIENSK